MEDAKPTTSEPPMAQAADTLADALTTPVDTAEWTLSEIASWLCLSAGIVVLAFTMLIPEVMRNQRHAHELRVLEIDKDRSEKTLARHQSMLLALDNDDPQLLEHLALTQLHLQPVGTRPLNPPAADPAASMTSVADLQAYVAGSASADAVERWLNPPQVPASELVPKYREPPTRLVQWTTAWPYRDFALFLGIVMLVAGLWPKVRKI